MKMGLLYTEFYDDGEMPLHTGSEREQEGRSLPVLRGCRMFPDTYSRLSFDH